MYHSLFSGTFPKAWKPLIQCLLKQAEASIEWFLCNGAIEPNCLKVGMIHIWCEEHTQIRNMNHVCMSKAKE